jgi:hypothetical protein
MSEITTVGELRMGLEGLDDEMPVVILRDYGKDSYMEDRIDLYTHKGKLRLEAF